MSETYTVESALDILNKGNKIFYLGLDNEVKSLKIKREKLGYTFLFGKGFDNDDIIFRRWYVNGETDLIEFLSNNLEMKGEEYE